MTGAAVLLLVQAGALVISPPAPTVGDTVRVLRTIEAPADARARAQPLGSSLLVEPLADPVVGRSARGVTVRYTLALFEAGRHPVGVPPVELLYRDGRVHLVPADTAWITVRTVLPARDPLPEPAPSLGPVARYPTRGAPLIGMVSLVLAGTTAWMVVRRRVKRTAESPRAGAQGATPPLMRWVAAGEARAVAAVAADRLRERIAGAVPEADLALSADECMTVLEARRPDWPLRELADVLRALERARFAPAVPTDVAVLVDRVDALASAL